MILGGWLRDRRTLILALYVNFVASNCSWIHAQGVETARFPTALATTIAPGKIVHEFTLVNADIQGVRVWLPTPIIVRRGENVRIKLINNLTGENNQDGFAIEDFGVKSLVKLGKPVVVEFVADKAGLFPIHCPLHPSHIGGQLMVIE